MDKFVVSARKYRPVTFRDVVGQSSIVTTLKLSIKSGQLGHAYLFSGPRGVGKTTCARIFARTINCTDLSEDGEACNKCESCISFNENRSYSIHELDAASNNTVEDIRSLTEQVRIPPQVGKFSIYIIDEVHMLSQQAFNAFLKTLEEPPAHAIFVLATTEKHKIIPTILSRCQIFDFNRISASDMVEALRSVAEKESVESEEDALHVIARKADGAMRDALSIFDQVVSFSEGRIRYKAVVENLNILDTEYYFRLTGHALDGDAPAMLLLFNEILARGFDARNFINGYAAHLRDLMVCKDPETIQLIDAGAGFREKYLEQSGKVSLSFLYQGLEICNQADIQFRMSRHPRLTIELALVKLANLSQGQKKKPLKESPQEKAEDKAADPEPTPTVSDSGTDNGANAVVRNPSISIRGSIQETPDPEGEPAASGIPVSESADEPGAPGELQPEKVLRAWEKFAESVQKSHPRIYSTMQSNRPEVGADGVLTLRLNSEVQKDNFHKLKTKLLEFLRTQTGYTGFDLQTEVQQPQQNGSKIYTDQDKLDYLVGKNPDLAKLKSRFNLDFDQ